MNRQEPTSSRHFLISSIAFLIICGAVVLFLSITASVDIMAVPTPGPVINPGPRISEMCNRHADEQANLSDEQRRQEYARYQENLEFRNAEIGLNDPGIYEECATQQRIWSEYMDDLEDRYYQSLQDDE